MAMKNSFKAFRGIVSIMLLIMIIGCSGGGNPIVNLPDMVEQDPQLTGDVPMGKTPVTNFIGGIGGGIIAKWVFDQATGWAFGKGLETLWGLAFGGDSGGEFEVISQQLGEINQKLDEIKNEIGSINASIDNLISLVNCMEIKLTSHTTYVNAMQNKNMIDQHVSNALSEYFSLDNPGQLEGLDGNLANFASDRSKSGDLDYQIRNIHTSLVDTVSSDGLLTLWAKEIVECKLNCEKNNAPRLSLPNAYEILHSYFCNFLETEIEGFYLLCECKDVVKTANENGFKYPGLCDKQKYFENDFKPFIEAQLRQYIRCVEYLVISYSNPLNSFNAFLPNAATAVLSEADFFVAQIWYSLLCGRDSGYPMDCQQCRKNDPNYGVVLRVIGDEQWVDSWSGVNLKPAENGGWMSNPNPVNHPIFTTRGGDDEKRYAWSWWQDGNGYVSWDPTLTKAKRAQYIKVKRLYYPVASSEYAYPSFNVDNPFSDDDRVIWGNYGPIDYEFSGEYNSWWNRNSGDPIPPEYYDASTCARFRSQVLPLMISPKEAFMNKYRFLAWWFVMPWSFDDVNGSLISSWPNDLTTFPYGPGDITDVRDGKKDRFKEYEFNSLAIYYRCFKWIGEDDNKIGMYVDSVQNGDIDVTEHNILIQEWEQSDIPTAKFSQFKRSDQIVAGKQVGKRDILYTKTWDVRDYHNSFSHDGKIREQATGNYALPIMEKDKEYRIDLMSGLLLRFHIRKGEKKPCDLVAMNNYWEVKNMQLYTYKSN